MVKRRREEMRSRKMRERGIHEEKKRWEKDRLRRRIKQTIYKAKKGEEFS